jgi:hypothetical protein
VHGFLRMYHGHQNPFKHTRWYFYMTLVKWKLISVCLEIVLIRHKIGAWFSSNVPRASKSFQAHPMVLLYDVGQVEAHFGLFGDNINLNAS